jgi:hypothetical protein
LYVIISNGEVIFGYKIQDFRFVLIYVYNYYRVALIGFGDHSFVVDSFFLFGLWFFSRFLPAY